MHDDRTVVPGLEDEPVFAEPWQAQAFAMTVALHERGLFGWGEWAAALSRELEADPDYWSAWLRALEAVMAEHGVAGGQEIEETAQAWRKAADATPHGEPIALEGHRSG